jgi:hypothetical protein
MTMTRVAACLTIMLARSVWAQGETSAIVLEQPASARALALGDAMVAVRDGDGSLFTNVALMDATRGASGSLSGQHYVASSSLVSASGSVRAAGGTLGVGVRGLDYGSVAEFIPDTANFGGQRGVATGRDVTASEIAITAGYARVTGRLHFGAALGYVRQQIADESSGAASADVGAAVELSRGIVLGAAVQQIGADLHLASTSSPLPRVVRAGASVPFRLGALGTLVAGEAIMMRSGDVLPRAGAEVNWRTANGITLVARGGVQGRASDALLSAYTFGAGIAGGHVALDYAYQGMGALGGAAHRVGVRFQR